MQNDLNLSIKRFLVRFGSDGQTIWTRLLADDTSIHIDSYLYNVVALKDGGFVAVGSTFGHDSMGRLSQAGWAVKVDSLGYLTDDCDHLGIPQPNLTRAKDIKIYPNPTDGIVYLESALPFPKATKIVLIDNSGRLIKTLASPSGKTRAEYDVKGLSSGIYFLRIVVNGVEILKKVNLQE